MRVKTNKVGYTAYLVACGWVGAMMEKVTGAFGQVRSSSFVIQSKKRYALTKSNLFHLMKGICAYLLGLLALVPRLSSKHYKTPIK